MEEWQGEISIEKSFKEIKEILAKLARDVADIKTIICEEESEGKWDYWNELVDRSKNGGEE